MNKYHIHLALSIVGLLVVSLAIFVLFRHIEIRKFDLENFKGQKTVNADGTTTTAQSKKRHNSKDDVVIVLRVLLLLILLFVIMDADTGLRWITIAISYLLVVFLSLVFLAKGTEVPQNVRDRKWEYLSLFSFLVFAAGAMIALIERSAVMSKYGKSYFGAARIVAYDNGQNDDDANNDDGANGDEDEENDEEGEDGDQDDEDDEDEEENDNEDEENDEEQDDEGDNEGEEQDEGDEDRRLEDGENGDEDDGDSGDEDEDDGDSGDEDEDDGDEDNDEDNDEDESSSSSSSEDDKGDAQENAFIKVSWGGEWGCPSSPDTYCETEIETSCDMWDLDVASAYDSKPANWKYWSSDSDSRLDGSFSCGYGFEQDVDDAAYDPDTAPSTYVYSGGDDDANNNGDYPYGYIVGDCKKCSAQWAWKPYYRRYEAMEGYQALYQNCGILSGVALLCYGLASCGRKFSKKRQGKRVELLKNEGGVAV